MTSTFGSSPTSSGGKQRTIAPNDHAVPQAGNDGISSLTWSPTANVLVSSNWDGGVRCWQVEEAGQQVRAVPKAQVNHDGNAPVLCTAFSADGGTVFSGGCDKAVRMWNLGGNPAQAQQIGVHDAPVKAVAFSPKSSMVVSCGWDKKLKFWDARSPNPVGVMDLPERAYDMDMRGNVLVVATAARQMVTFDLSQGQPRLHLSKDSPLKYMSRCVTVFPDESGFAVGSIEGRVGIHYYQKSPNRDSFAFKCHRQDSAVYSVNAIAFHPQFGTFATVGSDGVVNFWDKDNKQRLKGFNAIQQPIPCAAFNGGGNLFAYASSYDWSKGSGFYTPGSTPNEIFIHYTPEEEIKQKSKKKLGR